LFKEKVLNEFLSLPIEKRFEKITKKTRNGWFLVDFYKSFSKKE
jgi:hypothetical protein